MTEAGLPTAIFLHPSDELYGADRQLIAVMHASSGLVRPLVLLPDDLAYEGRLSDVLRSDGVEVHHGPLPVLRRRYASLVPFLGWTGRLIRGTWWVMQAARRTDASLIVSNSASIPVGPVAAMLLRRRHIWVVREIIDRPRWFRRLVRSLPRSAGGIVIVVSQAVADWLGPISGRGPVVLHDGVRAPDVVEVLGAEPIAAYVGRLNDWKGWDVFVRAAAIVHQRVPGARLELVGGVAPGATTSSAGVEDAIARVDPSETWLRWAGEAPDAAAIMREAWVVAVPSRLPDPFPNVVLEAMAAGRAVVGTAVGGIPEMIVDGVTGILVPPDDEAALAEALVTLLSDQPLAERMGRAGRVRLESELSIERFAEAWRSVLTEQLAKGRR